MQNGGRLYPELDPDWAPAVGTTAAWGQHPDEDAYEWACSIYGALETFSIARNSIEAGETSSYPWPILVELKHEDGIWTFTLRRNVAYLHSQCDRERWLTNQQIDGLFREITGFPDRDDYAFDDPPNVQSHLFIDVHSLVGPLTPEGWLRQIAEHAVTGERLPLPPET